MTSSLESLSPAVERLERTRRLILAVSPSGMSGTMGNGKSPGLFHLRAAFADQMLQHTWFGRLCDVMVESSIA